MMLITSLSLLLVFSGADSELQKIPIEIVSAKSWYRYLDPSNALDGNYNTFYSVKDKDTEGNFLRLKLFEPWSVGHVRITNRLDRCCQHRITGTKVEVRNSRTNEIVGDCGTISINDYNEQQQQDWYFQTYTLDCNGAVGDVIYITDTIIERYGDGNSVGHGISEVQAFGRPAGCRFEDRFWVQPQKVVFIPVPQNQPLYLKTDSTVGSGAKIYVNWYSPEKKFAGNLNVLFTNPPRYLLAMCSTWHTFPVALPSQRHKIWKISKIPGPRVVVTVNDVEVLNLGLTDYTCDDGNYHGRYGWWSDSWGRDVSQIYFPGGDTATDYYYTGTC